MAGLFVPQRFTVPAPLRPGPHIPVWAFGRFDEITDLVEKASDLTLPDFRSQRPLIRCDIHVAKARDVPPIKILGTANILLTPAATRAQPARSATSTD
jgi:hypothetical protein